MNSPKVTAVVVTFDRLPLLERCLASLLSQTYSLTSILVVNNASTDGTAAYLDALASNRKDKIAVIHLAENTGGAGGFSEGLRLAIAGGAGWVWMMDDDAEPDTDALAELMQVVDSTENIYGSLATSGRETSWLMTLQGNPTKTTGLVDEIPTRASVLMLPFLGFLVHRELVQKIGLPDPGFFLAADDAEYCIRARKAGAQIMVAGKSHIEHPKSDNYRINLLGCTLVALALPPWKRYYDTRNRLLIARKHFGLKLFTQTMPGLVVRMTATLIREPRKLAQLKAFGAGVVDGFLGRKGRRHETWGVK